jgi:predicted SAM-dependent methyltransferase
MSEQVERIDIFTPRKEWSFWRLLKVEGQSLLGRLFFQRIPKLKSSEENYLNLCCGKKVQDGWINADFYFSKWTKIWRSKKKKPNWFIDLRYKLKCPDNVIDGVFSEHTLEHIYPHQVLNVLKELHRIMKPGAYLRIAVPDLEKCVEFYNNPIDEEYNKRFASGAEALRSLTQNWFHLSAWDAKLMESALTKAGFRDVKKCAFRQGSCDALLKDHEEHRWETLYIEARK